MEAQEQSSLGLDANIAAGLSQVFGIITGLIFFFIETKSKFVKTYAMQAVLLWGAFVALEIVATVFSTVLSLTGSYMLIGLVGMVVGLLFTVLGLGSFVLWIILMVFAFQGKEFKLPVIGQIAEDMAVKSLSANTPPMQ